MKSVGGVLEPNFKINLIGNTSLLNLALFLSYSRFRINAVTFSLKKISCFYGNISNALFYVEFNDVETLLMEKYFFNETPCVFLQPSPEVKVHSG